ncbi:hypothetical protein K3X41_00770 [Aliiroseovarius crassostreae]|uniref:ATP-grasp domain-containing protein n=1 Tax=Aliiroseovarius crassostreae TaxID=154981 RepID=UPI0022058E21|nr:hypothetical protein [Aliiroseovarius crassostreae]UWQ11268.1 hypothetical protein K3X41_00770 [Aliiroseovarius crassostreae]
MEPQTRIGLANLTKMAYQGQDLTPVQTRLLRQCLSEGPCEGALMDLSVIEQLQGNQPLGLEWQAKALSRQRAFVTNQGECAKRRVLVFAKPGHMGANTPVEFLLQRSDFEIITYYPHVSDGTHLDLPDHDVAFCAIPADTATTDPIFGQVRQLAASAGSTVLNLPGTQLMLERHRLEQRFSYVPGLRFPQTKRVTLDELVTALMNETEDQMLSALGSYPIVIRPCGSHAGKGLANIPSREALISYLVDHPEPAFFLSEFIDYATPHDGQFRKYRVVFVDGQPFPCHMAIAAHWDIWYLNAGMEACADKRREEARFMDHFHDDFATRHKHALRALTDGIGLGYFGIDCAEDAQGNLVVFEADNALIVHDMDCDTTFPYKPPHMQRIFAAFEEMLLKNCRPTGSRDPAPFQFRPSAPRIQLSA